MNYRVLILGWTVALAFGCRSPLPPAREQPLAPRIQPGMALKISVLVDDKMEASADTLRVTESGEIRVPLLGSVRVGGQTIETAASSLTGQYRAYYRNPVVVLDFVTDDKFISPWGNVTVFGRVKQPGRVNIPATRDLRVSDAIQKAGGLDTSANISAVRITRQTAGGSPVKIVIDLQAVGSEGKGQDDQKLEPGDIVFVPERIF